MKAYVTRNAAALTPFDRPAAAVSLGSQTVGARLRDSLMRQGLEIVDCDRLDTLRPEPHSLAIQDDVAISAGFVKVLLAAVAGRTQDAQIFFESGKLPVFSTRNATPQFRALPIFYFGERPKDTAPEHLEIQPDVVFDTEEGMPQRIGAFTDLRLYFLECYAVHVRYWFDLLIATGAFAREYLVERIRPFRGRIPRGVLYRALGNRWVREHSNAIGRGCRIHPTAILEGCVIGDNVEIGPYCYLRSSVVARNAVLREGSTAKVAFIGAGASIGSTDVTNCYIGAESFILSQVLNVVIGERVFLAGGSGFADFAHGANDIGVAIDGEDIPSGLTFLGSAVGDGSFIGAGLVFAPGRTIPAGTSVLNHQMIKDVPAHADAIYVASGGNLVQIPAAFLGR